MKGLEDIHIFQFEKGCSGTLIHKGVVKRKVHKAFSAFPGKINCADQPLCSRKFFWVTLFRSSRQKWPVIFEENLDNLDWLIRGWHIDLPSGISTNELKLEE